MRWRVLRGMGLNPGGGGWSESGGGGRGEGSYLLK